MILEANGKMAYYSNVYTICSVLCAEEPAKVGTCARDRHALQQLALNVRVNYFDLDLDLCAFFFLIILIATCVSMILMAVSEVNYCN